MNVTDLRGPLNIRVRLDIPKTEKSKRCEQHGYDGAEGVILAPAGNGGYGYVLATRLTSTSAAHWHG